MIRLIALDLDGTLLNDAKTIPQENIEMIQRAKEKGIKVVLCSGRSQQSLEYLLQILKLNVPGQYGIALNGAVVFEADTGKILCSSTMQKTAAQSLIENGLPLMNEINIQVYDKDHVYVQRWDHTTTYYEKVTHVVPVVVDSLLDHTENVIKLSYFRTDKERLSPECPIDRIQELKQRVEHQIPDSICGQITAPYLLEFMDNHVHKGVGMENLGKILNIAPEEMMAVGDLENDLGMIRYAGLGIAMRNGAEVVKQEAQYVTERTNNEGGVAEVIEKFALN